MKRFKFNLNKVLKVRKLEEELTRDCFLQAQNKARELEGRLDEMCSVQNEIYQFLRQEKGLTIEENIGARHFLCLHRQKINELENCLTSQQEKVSQCRHDYLEKRRECQALDRLKDKEYNRYYQELLHKEQQELDEIGQRVKEIRGGIG